MREIRQSGSVRGVRRNLYPYRDYMRAACFYAPVGDLPKTFRRFERRGCRRLVAGLLLR